MRDLNLNPVTDYNATFPFWETYISRDLVTSCIAM